MAISCELLTQQRAMSNSPIFSTLHSLALSHRKQLATTSSQHNIPTVHGKVTPSKLKSDPNVKFCRLLGKVTPSKLWLNSNPKVKLCRLLGKVTPCKVWLNQCPKVKLCRLLGKIMPSKLWPKLCPKVKSCRLLGKITPSKLWSKLCPKVKFWRLLGKVMPQSRVRPVKVKLTRLLGRWTRQRGDGAVKCVTPSKEISASDVSSSIKKHHAACNWVGQDCCFCLCEALFLQSLVQLQSHCFLHLL